MLRLSMNDFGLLDEKQYELHATKIDTIIQDPPFTLVTPDFEKIDALVEKYNDKHNIILIAQGGQLQPVIALAGSLAKKEKRLHILNSQDPDHLAEVLMRTNNEDSIVIASSKSGNTASVLQLLFSFHEYPIVAITTKGSGTLWDIVQKDKLDYLAIPNDLGGRYTGTSESAYFPLALLGVDVRKIHAGAITMYAQPDVAFLVSAALYEAEQNNLTEVFMPVYSRKLFSFGNLIMQLCHESFGKDEKGLTILCCEAPESQHHTNQRFFGGKKTMMGFFMRVAEFKNDATTKCPEKWKTIRYSKGALGDMHLPYQTALHFEFEGTQRDATQSTIPNIVLTVDKVDCEHMGQLMAFWQYVAVYSSLLRDVDPYDQPQVENSKQITRDLTFSFTGEYKDPYV